MNNFLHIIDPIFTKKVQSIITDDKHKTVFYSEKSLIFIIIFRYFINSRKTIAFLLHRFDKGIHC